MLVGTDLDGTFGLGRNPPPSLCISGRTWAEYDDACHQIAAMMPLYIRGRGAFGDREDAAIFKVAMIQLLGVDLYYEDDPYQAAYISNARPNCKVVLVGVTS